MTSDIEKLVASGFTKIGTWRLTENAEDFLIHKLAPDLPGIYAFVADNKVMYVGSSSGAEKTTLKRRLRDYQRKASSSRDAKKRRPVHHEIMKIHQSQGQIEVYALTIKPTDIHIWNGLPIDLVLGIEHGLIKTLDPNWNRRGRKRD